MRNVVVIGAGPAGMTAAISAARAGARVTLVEKNKRPGVKLLLTGNGRCNLANLDREPAHYHGSRGFEEIREFVGAAAESFGFGDTPVFFGDLGLLMRERGGYVYPLSNRSESVLEVLESELQRLKVKTSYNTEVLSVYQDIPRDDDEPPHFHVKTSGWTYLADAVIIAAGSMAAPKTGSAGDGYRFAEEFAHTVIKPLPALVPLVCGGDFFVSLAGTRIQAEVSILADGRCLASDTGEVQFTKNGISGIPVLQVSRYAVKALDEGRCVQAVLNLLPESAVLGGTGFRDAYGLLKSFRERLGHKSCLRLLTGLFPARMAECILKITGTGREVRAADLSDGELGAIAEAVSHFTVNVVSSGGFAAAQVCSGGVDIAEIELGTMESKYINGLYFAGETVDIDGDCGGYNLQWAFSSGYTAGTCAAAGETKP